MDPLYGASADELMGEGCQLSSNSGMGADTKEKLNNIFIGKVRGTWGPPKCIVSDIPRFGQEFLSGGPEVGGLILAGPVFYSAFQLYFCFQMTFT
jgi:hypothetical protein